MVGQTVLVTGCSDGGLGAELALAFHKAGYRVIATARNVKKMANLVSHGIETVPLDVLSPESIKHATQEVNSLLGGSLDMLVNNAGAGYSMPIADVDINELRNLFELNVFSLVTVTQAFLPLLRKSSDAAIVINTSIASVIGPPIQAPYNASKAAAAMLTNNLRVELQPFKIKVVELKTGAVKTNFFVNVADTGTSRLPEDSIYNLGKDLLEPKMHGDGVMDSAIAADVWAKQVVADLSKTHPPSVIWRGGTATLARFVTFLPISWLDGSIKKLMGLDIFEQRLAKAGQN